MSRKIKSRNTNEKVSKFSTNKNIKYFKKSFFQYWDKKFMLILSIAILIEAICVSILAMKPVEKYSEKEIKKIQDQFASFILEKDPIEEKREITVSTGSGSEEVEVELESESTSNSEKAGSGGEKGSGSGSEGTESTGTPVGSSTSTRATTSAEARRQARREVSRKVSSKGLLGILTSSNKTSAKDGAVSIFESGRSSNEDKDLDNLLSSLDGLKTLRSSSEREGNAGGKGVYGKRTGREAGIDDLISEDEGANSELLSRKGELTIESSKEEGGKGSREKQYRSAEAIQQVLLSHNQVIKYCYERELKRYPTLKGKVVVRITVNPKGEVVNASILSSTLNNERVERCIIARINHWNDFRPVNPKAGDVTFRQTYVFGY